MKNEIRPFASWETKVEQAYPEAFRLARRFHELYEENAPKFGYKTRGDTKEFIADSPNGRLMAFVCWTLIDEEATWIKEEIKDR